MTNNWREHAQAKAEKKLAKACDFIGLCEADLGRKLSAGELRDLLIDNFQWDHEVIVVVVAELGSMS